MFKNLFTIIDNDADAKIESVTATIHKKTAKNETSQDDWLMDLEPAPEVGSIKPNSIVQLNTEHQTTKTATIFDKSSFSENVLTRIAAQKMSKTVKSIPYAFGDKRMQEKTTCACYYCTHKFENKIIGLPTYYDPRKKLFKLFGVFCSYECAFAFGQRKSHSHRTKMFCGSWLLKLRKIVHKIAYATPLRPAPHWCRLQRFGGDLSIQEFRSQQVRLEKVIAQPCDFLRVPFGFDIFFLSRNSSFATRDDKVNIRRSKRFIGKKTKSISQMRRSFKNKQRNDKLNIVNRNSKITKIRNLKNVLKRKIIR